MKEKIALSYVPSWCYMPPDEHLCAGGCWGILYGEVAQKGKEYCKTCEYNEDNLKTEKEQKLLSLS